MAETETPGHLLKKYETGDTPGASNLNFNWDTIDTRLMGVGGSFPTTYAVTGLFLRTDEAKLYENTGTIGTPVWTLRLSAELAPHAATHKHGGADEVATATPAANAIPKAGAGGTLADDFISESSVVQHIDDAGTTTEDIWSASKIQTVVDGAVVGLYEHKGAYNAATNTPDLDATFPNGAKTGDAYTVSVAGTFFTEPLEVGDVIIADQDDPSALAHWTRVQKNVDQATTTTKGIVELATDGESAANVVVQGNDSRLSDNRTDADAIHDNVSGEIVAVTEKTAPHGDDEFLGEDSQSSNAKASFKLKNIRDLDFWHRNAQDTDRTISGDRPTGPTGTPPAVTDLLTPGLKVLRYDDTIEMLRSLGSRRIKASALTLNIKALWRAESAPLDGTKDIGWKLYWREIPVGGAVSATWAGTNDGFLVLDEIANISADTDWHESEHTLVLATQSIPTDREYELGISRILPTGGAGSKLPGDWDVRRYTMTLKG